MRHFQIENEMQVKKCGKKLRLRCGGMMLAKSGTVY
jgi:hypothetical protein